ncbi:transcriptional antiterminator RfaH [Pseudomonas duriflava]|uniref:Transcription antitermination protein RfaH n=1 Tax=Pseudomonas duriflava TaxID=459528 RepID=A0A562PS55_9PSED|nr:transcription/translation regulatory transformer protein RfaH [Pseudomonas duriflava]TWI47275.1 transcriptional antiterminator RfaH [Pseudomonas duriflava]
MNPVTPSCTSTLLSGASLKPKPQWYLIQTKPRQDSRAEEHLQRQHFDCYRPLRKVQRLHRGRPDAIEEPLFPGYLFIRLDRLSDNWYPIRSTRGVSRIVSFGEYPVPVRDSIIEEIQQRLSQENKTPAPLFCEGERVRINQGSFAELEAIFLASDGEARAVILLNLLQREQKVTVPMKCLSRMN